MNLILPIVSASICALSLGIAIVVALDRRPDVRRHLAALEQAGVDSARHEHLGVFRHVLDDERRSRLEQRLIEAGWYNTTPRAMALRATAIAGIAGTLALGVALFLGFPTMLTMAMAFVFAACGALLPNRLLTNAIKARKSAITRALPDFLDMISTSVQAGTALNGALAAGIDGVRGPLKEELLAVLSDIRMGRSRADALSAMAQRAQITDLTTTVTAIVQAEKLGGDIAKILDELAIDARERRMTRAEELAAQLPVKMTLPMTLCMLPALFAIIFGSVAAQSVRW